MSEKWKSDDVAEPRQTQIQGIPMLKRCLKVLLALYIIYVGFHFLTANHKGCNLHMTLMTMFPVRELYAIPSIDRMFMESFLQSSATEHSNQKLSAGIAGIGWEIKDWAIDLLASPDACLLAETIVKLESDGDGDLIAEFWSDLGALTSGDANSGAARPSKTPNPTSTQRRFHPYKYGRLTGRTATLYAGISQNAKQRGSCTNPTVLTVKAEHDRHYEVYCDGHSGYINKKFVRLTNQPPSARLIPSTAFLYTRPHDSAKEIAICHQIDIRSVEERVGDFYRVRCDGKLGWIKAIHVETSE